MQLDDRELIARTLQAEAGNQGLGGMLAVGSVIKNRMGSGQSFRDIILAPAQFSAWNKFTGAAGGEQGQDMSKIKPSEDAYAAADALISGNIADITGGATHYYNPDISNPAWGASAGGDWTKIGSHVFGKAGDFRTGAKDMIGAQAPQQMAQQEKPRGLLGGMIDRDFADQLYMAALAGSPNARQFAPLIQSVQAGRQARREDAKEQKKLELAQKGRNATADYLDSIGQSELGNLVRQGAITGANALSSVPKPDAEKTFQYQSLAKDLLRTGVAKTEAEALQMALSQTKAGTTVNVGPQGQQFPPPPSGYVYRYNADNTVMLNDEGVPMVAPLAGSKADLEAREREEKLGKTRTMQERGQSVVSKSVQEALNILDTDTGIIPVAGTYGKFAADYLPDQEARNLKRTLEALQANTAFTRLQEMRDASQTGGALGNVSNVELGLLMSAYGSISQDLDPKILRKNLQEIDRIMGKIENDPIASAFYNEGVDLRGSDLDKQVKSGSPSSKPKRLRFDAQGNIIND